MKNNLVVYTCNFGDYDSYKPVKYPDSKVKYVLFTDKDVEVEGWEIRVLDPGSIHKNVVKAARYVKINSHKMFPDFYWTIWVDAAFTLKKCNVWEYLCNHINGDINCYKHGNVKSKHICIYREAKVCIEAGLDDNDVIQKQIDRYRLEGFLEDAGLYSTGIVVRTNSPRVHKFNETWWEEVINGSQRDQLSQRYASWKSRVRITRIKKGDVYNNEFVGLKHKHLK